MNIAIFTAPHSTCAFPSIGGYGCEPKTKNLVTQFCNDFKRKGINCESIIGDIHRSEIDLNRTEGRNTAFRKAIDESLERNPDAILFDIHNFPENSKTWRGLDVVVFDMPPSIDNNLSKKMLNALKRQGLNVRKAKGTIDNDIVNTAFPNRALLLEINDGISKEKSKKISRAMQDIF